MNINAERVIGERKMDRVTIILNKIDDIKMFIDEVSTVSFGNQIDLISGRYRVSALSLMGIFALDTSKPITMEYPEMFKKVVENRFNRWIVKD